MPASFMKAIDGLHLGHDLRADAVAGKKEEFLRHGKFLTGGAALLAARGPPGKDGRAERQKSKNSVRAGHPRLGTPAHPASS